MKKEFIFEVETDDGMLVATCHEPEMATQGETLDELSAMSAIWCNAASRTTMNDSVDDSRNERCLKKRSQLSLLSS